MHGSLANEAANCGDKISRYPFSLTKIGRGGDLFLFVIVNATNLQKLLARGQYTLSEDDGGVG